MIGTNIGDVTAHLRMNTSQFDSALQTSQQRVQKFATDLGRIGSYLTLRLTLPLVYFGQRATKAFSGFDDALTRSAAVTKGMTSTLRKEMAKTALSLSKESLLSARELAEGYFALGQAGYTAAQSIKALPVVEDFAIASSKSLDESIRYLVRTVNGLGMASEDPIKNMEALVKVSNSFTYAAITTTAEIEDFAVAMTHAAAPALKLVNKGMQEGTSVLMSFALAGIQAEEAGTLLWTTVRDLQRANITARSEWKRYGLTIYDSAGKMRNLADIFSDLERRFGGMSDEGKKVSLMLLGFQDRSLRGIQALMGFSDAMKYFQKQMEEGGNITEKIANAYLKSFHGQLIMTKNTIEVFSISLGRTLAPIILRINEHIKAAVNWWEQLSDKTRLVIVEIGILLAVLGPLLIIFSKMVWILSFASMGFGVLAKAIWVTVAALATLSWEVTLVIVAIAAMIVQLYVMRALWNQNIEAIEAFTQIMKNKFKEAFEYVANNVIRPFIRWVKNDYFEFIKDMAGITRVLSPALLKDLIQGKDIAQSFVEGREMINRVLNLAEKDIKFQVKTIGAVVETGFEFTKDSLKVTLGEIRDAVKKQFGEDVAAVFGLVSKRIEEMNAKLLALLPSEQEQEMINFVEMVRKAKDDILSLLNISADITSIWGSHLRAAMSITERFEEVAVRAFDNISDALTEFVTTGKMEIKSLVAMILKDLLNAIIRAKMAAFWKGIMGEQTTGEGGSNWLGTAIGGALGGIRSWFKGADAAAKMTTEGVTASVGATGSFASSSFNKALGGVFSQGQLVPMAAGSIINSATLIPLKQRKTALIGEAGPEAVMPLTRNKSGHLGVRAEQPNVNINNQTKIVNVFDHEEMLSAMRSDAGGKVILNIMKRKGII